MRQSGNSAGSNFRVSRKLRYQLIIDPAGRVQLSVRQVQVLRLLCTVAPPTKEIAAILRLSTHTVDGYIDEIVGELGLSGRQQLIVWGWQHPEAMMGCPVEPSFHPPGCLCGRAICALLEDAA